MDQQDFRDLRSWFRKAVIRAKEAEFDIIYAYANHYYLLHNFQNTEINNRDDYYGGDAKGRSKLLKEIIEILKEEAQDKMAVAVRFSPDENINDAGISLEPGEPVTFACILAAIISLDPSAPDHVT